MEKQLGADYTDCSNAASRHLVRGVGLIGLSLIIGAVGEFRFKRQRRAGSLPTSVD